MTSRASRRACQAAALTATSFSLVLTSVLAAGPAAAEIRTVNDPKGDGPRAYDVRSAKFNNARQSFVATVRFHTLKPSGAKDLYATADPVRNPQFLFYAGLSRRTPRGKLVPTFVKQYGSDATVVRCKGLKAKITKRTLKVVVPQACFKVAKRSPMQGAALAAGRKGGTDSSPVTQPIAVG